MSLRRRFHNISHGLGACAVIASFLILAGASCDRTMDASKPTPTAIPDTPSVTIPVTPQIEATGEVMIKREETNVREFRVVAKKFSFNPSTLEVNQGDRVRVIFTSMDVTHGFSLPQFNVDLTASPGEERVAEFTAHTAGTYTFRCSVYCGAGHTEMIGNFIVR